MKSKRAKIGRPSTFTPELAERACAYIAQGLTVSQMAAKEGMPTFRTFFRWLASEGEAFAAFRQQYVRARELRAEARFERMRTIARKAERGLIDPAAARVSADIEKWCLGRESGKYGESLTLKGDKDNPLQHRVARELTDEELQALAAGGLRAAD